MCSIFLSSRFVIVAVYCLRCVFTHPIIKVDLTRHVHRVSCLLVSRFLLSLRRVSYARTLIYTEPDAHWSSIRFHIPDDISGNIGELLEFDDSHNED